MISGSFGSLIALNNIVNSGDAVGKYLIWAMGYLATIFVVVVVVVMVEVGKEGIRVGVYIDIAAGLFWLI